MQKDYQFILSVKIQFNIIKIVITNIKKHLIKILTIDLLQDHDEHILILVILRRLFIQKIIDNFTMEIHPDGIGIETEYSLSFDVITSQ